MKKKKKYLYPTVSIKIHQRLVEEIRERKKESGVSIQDFIETAVIFALTQKPLKQK